MLSNTATPRYYAEFRDDVLAGRIPVCKEIEMEMNRIDDRIRNPGFYYDSDAVEGFIRFAEAEMTLTDGSDLRLLPSFKLWAEEIFGWWFFTERSVYVPNKTKAGGHFEKRRVKQRLINKQYIIVARGGAKSLYETLLQAYFLTIDTSTTHQVTTAPTMKQAEEVMQPFRTAITRAKGPLFDFMTQGSLQNTTGNRALRQKLVPTKKGIENFMTNSLLEVRPMSIDKLQGLRTKMNTVDEWLSGDIREDVVGAIEQGASKVDDWLILAVSSEGTVRNSAGDNMKMELLNILRGEYSDPHTSIFYYRLDHPHEGAAHAAANSLYNTPPTWQIYLLHKVMQWIERAGGVIHFDRASAEKSALLYAYLDRSDYYSNTIAPQYRSRTNIVFRTRSAELDTRFWQEAEKNGLSGLKGHKIVGGLRASLYNALDIRSVHALIDYMDAFAAENP